MFATLTGGVAGAIWRRSPALRRRAPARQASVACGLLAAVPYALLAGWGIPAQRTVLMLACVALAWIARRRRAPGRALLLAAFAVSAFDPWAVTTAGFWLSFGAVAAIVWMTQGRPQPGPTASGALTTAARVQLAV
jgi:competence protein ComEC